MMSADRVNKIIEATEKLTMFLIPDNETATAEGKVQLQVRLQRSTDPTDQTAASHGSNEEKTEPFKE